MNDRRFTGIDPEELPDTPYLVYCLVQAFKLFLNLALKRWPDVR